MRWQDYIERNPKVMLGKPVIKGTRITVERILEMMSEGSNDADIISSYPHINGDHIRAALAYAAASLSTDEVVFLGDQAG